MSGYRFRRAPGDATDERWRPLDDGVARWVRAHGGSALLARVAGWTSFADGLGDTALQLRRAGGYAVAPTGGERDAGTHGLPAVADDGARSGGAGAAAGSDGHDRLDGLHGPDVLGGPGGFDAPDGFDAIGLSPLDAAAFTALAAGPMVGDAASDATPFVLDAQDRFYLRRNFDDERAVADALLERLAGAEAGPAVVDDTVLDRLFGGDRSVAVEAQRRAVALAPGRRLFVLTGGPGTGKTSTVLRMLLLLQSRAPQPLSIALAAPTGKAAQRLLQSLRAGKVPLRTTLPPEWLPYLDAVPDTEASTLHRLLGFDARRNRFRHGARTPLAADVVVVDEASMVDLGVLRALLAAVRPDATLVLVGDADQLTSVAAGSALMDVVGALESTGAQDVVRLQHSFRATRTLVQVNEAVRLGDAAGLDAALAGSGGDAVRWGVDDATALARRVRAWTRTVAALPIRPLLPAAGSGGADAPEGADNAGDGAGMARTTAVVQALQALSGRQLLCALREEVVGALTLNALVERGLRQAWGVPDGESWYPGRAVMVTRNDYGARLFNGDVGLCLLDAGGRLRVWFEDRDAEGRPAVRAFAPGALPAHEGAFAITIHKSQGSEYAHAAVVLPTHAAHRALSRQLLYTGLSRAKQGVEIWASADTLQAALARPVLRAGGLAHRLRTGLAARGTSVS